MRSEYSAELDSLTEKSRRGDRVQTVEFRRMSLKRKEVRRKKEKKRVKQQEEPSQMKAVIKRLASDKYRGISQLLPATGWSHTEGMKERAQRSHISLFSTQSLVLSPCVFTPFPEGIKVNMLAYPQLPRTSRAFAAFISASSTLLPSSSPSLPSSLFPVIPLHHRCNLGFACLAQ